MRLRVKSGKINIFTHSAPQYYTSQDKNGNSYEY